jgi:hypothetical protein
MYIFSFLKLYLLKIFTHWVYLLCTGRISIGHNWYILYVCIVCLVYIICMYCMLMIFPNKDIAPYESKFKKKKIY